VRQPPLPPIDGRELLAIFAGGAAGTLARAGLAKTLPHGAGAWPWATFAVNLIGAFLLGFAVTRLQERLPLSRYRRPFLGTGLCGALTTFSTLQLELLRMLDGGHDALALGYAAASLAGGFAAVFLATQLARRTRTSA
jgi:fluoride exporter